MRKLLLAVIIGAAAAYAQVGGGITQAGAAGTVTTVSGTSPIASSGGSSPAVSCATCVTSVSGTANQVASTGGTTPVLSFAPSLQLPLITAVNGTTAAGNFGPPLVLFATPSSSTAAAISAVTMATPGTAGAPSPGLYRFSAYLVQTGIGSGGTCATNSEVSVQVAWKDGSTGNAITNTNSTSVNPFARTVGNSAINFLTLSNVNTTNTSSQGSVYPFVFYAQSGTAITYITTMVVTDNCTTHATYQVIPLLEAF